LVLSVTLQYYWLGMSHVTPLLTFILHADTAPYPSSSFYQQPQFSGSSNMSATASSHGSTSSILQQPLPLATKVFLDSLAYKIDARGNGLQDDDLWGAQERLRGIPIETLRVCEANMRSGINGLV